MQTANAVSFLLRLPHLQVHSATCCSYGSPVQLGAQGFNCQVSICQLGAAWRVAQQLDGLCTIITAAFREARVSQALKVFHSRKRSAPQPKLAAAPITLPLLCCWHAPQFNSIPSAPLCNVIAAKPFETISAHPPAGRTCRAPKAVCPAKSAAEF